MLKRAIDLLLSGAMLVLSSPAWLVIGAAIKLDSRGPVLYRQQRWGRGSTPFTLYKFRTMTHVAGGHEISQALVDDPRVTRVGKLLRRAGLDELPQMINIFKGEMSFVGPRALAVGEILELEPGERVLYEEMEGFRERLGVRPGLTGLATVYIPKDSSPLEKFRYDLRYIEERSLLLDLKLIVLSFWISFRGQWETRGDKF